MDVIYKLIEEILKSVNTKIDFEYYSSFYDLLMKYNNAMRYLESKDNSTFIIFYEWLSKEGMTLFHSLDSRIVTDKLDVRFKGFMKIYKLNLSDSLDNDNILIVLEFLYRIPKKMVTDFEDFGFLENQ